MASAKPATTPAPAQQSAPPNFYTVAGQMAAGQGGGQGNAPQQAGAQQGAPQQQPSQPNQQQAADLQFKTGVAKLLTVLQQMGDMRPGGMDISHFTQAMATTAKQMLQYAFKGPGNSASGTPSDTNGDLGDAANAGGLGGAAAAGAAPGGAPGGVS